MPRYMIERTFFVQEQEMPEVGTASKRIAAEKFPEIVWEHSHVVVDENGGVRTYCVYAAPDKDTVMKHAAELGRHNVDVVYEIAGDVTPADFPN
jgi:Protein of unknown function (DUF4242)